MLIFKIVQANSDANHIFQEKKSNKDLTNNKKKIVTRNPSTFYCFCQIALLSEYV